MFRYVRYSGDIAFLRSDAYAFMKGAMNVYRAMMEERDGRLSLPVLLAQGGATSIDALSVGFTIADYGPVMAVIASLVIAAVTFAICMAGLLIGRAAASTRLLTGRAQAAGGIILILIGAEIFIKGMIS